ncbi:MAG: SRPBCC family protein [Polyangiaceae bacterium]
MTLTAEAELTIAGPIESVFAQFIDYTHWAEWMPAVFRPIRGPARAIRPGDRLLMKVGGAVPSLLSVDRVEAPREVCWSGGVPGLAYARHSFYFDKVSDSATRIRSVEPWTGLLTMIKPLADGLLKAARAGGRDQLDGFERWFQQQRSARAA